MSGELPILDQEILMRTAKKFSEQYPNKCESEAK
jgi:hypothetical protein